jgi:hypothetical protein
MPNHVCASGTILNNFNVSTSNANVRARGTFKDLVLSLFLASALRCFQNILFLVNCRTDSTTYWTRPSALVAFWQRHLDRGEREVQQVQKHVAALVQKRHLCGTSERCKNRVWCFDVVSRVVN